MILNVIVLVIGIVFLLIIIKRKNRYDVFAFFDNRLAVLTIIPACYDIDIIEEITFSKIQLKTNFLGIMRIIKKGGSKSRPFLFDSCSYYKKFKIQNYENDIELTTMKLIEELQRHGIKCKKR